MARLIDADELLKDNTWEWFDDWGNYTLAGQAIADAPTVDAVEVVRCKDCKYRDPENGHCDHYMGTAIPLTRRLFDFCSYGAKMDGGDKKR